MSKFPRRTRLHIWIACFAILLNALAPSVSHALAALHGAPTLVEVCSVAGSKLVAVDQAAPDGGPSSSNSVLHHLEHCPYCMSHAGQGLLKLGYALRPDLRLTLSHRAYQESALRPNNPQSDASLGQAGAVPVQRNLLDQSQTSVGIEQTDTAGAPTLSARLYRTRLDASAEANPAQSLAASSSFTRTVGGGVQRTTRAGAHRLSYGIDGYRDEQDARNGGQPNPVTPPGRQTVAGVFVQDEWRLGDAWLLTPAARYDRYSTHVDGGAGADARQGHLSPKLTWRSRLVAAQSRDSTAERRTAGYASHDLFVNWRPADAPQLELSAGVSNLADKRYIVYQSENPTSRVVEMGRALQATLGWTF